MYYLISSGGPGQQDRPATLSQQKISKCVYVAWPSDCKQVLMVGDGSVGPESLEVKLERLAKAVVGRRTGSKATCPLHTRSQEYGH